MKSRPVCPRCGYTQFHSSRVRIFDWPFYLIGMVAWRCASCDRRFYRHRLAARPAGPPIANQPTRDGVQG